MKKWKKCYLYVCNNRTSHTGGEMVSVIFHWCLLVKYFFNTESHVIFSIYGIYHTLNQDSYVQALLYDLYQVLIS